MADTVTCYNCKQKLPAQPEEVKEQSIAESISLFGPDPNDEYDVLCDDCYKQFRAWMMRQGKIRQ